jgi:PilZ domain-containing protein
MHFRAYLRRPVKVRAVVARPKAAWQKDATVHDLSLGGVSLTLSGSSLALGDEVVVSFFAPSLWDPLALPARVAWVRATHEGGVLTVGLAFEPRDPSAVFALFELVSTVAP